MLLRSPTWILQLPYRWGGWGNQLFFVSRTPNPGSSRSSHGVGNSEPVPKKHQNINVLKSNESVENILLFWNFSHCTNSTARCAVTTARCAVTTVRYAVTTARCAVTTARCAVNTARCAVTTARCAVTTVRVAVTTARCAVTTAKCAVTTARCAVTTVRFAVTTARCAVTTARCAVTTARCAVTTARCAVTTARCAVTTLFPNVMCCWQYCFQNLLNMKLLLNRHFLYSVHILAPTDPYEF